jgi:hypothetical protein
MTAAEWLACTDPRVLLSFLQYGGRLSERKARLFGAACCRRIWSLPTDPRSRQSVEVAERFADGQAARSELNSVRTAALDATALPNHPTAAWAAQPVAAGRVAEVVRGSPESLHDGAPGAAADAAGSDASVRARAAGGDGEAAEQAARDNERRGQADLLRDLCGPLPFHPVAIAPSVLRWRGGTMGRLAQSAYDGRRLPAGTLEPERLAVLADALEEAGADDQNILGHLRDQGAAHVRGCWVLDLLLAKERWL